MKKVFKRVLLIMMAMLLVAGTVVPAAMAAEVNLATNASTTLYVGERHTLTVTRGGVRVSNTKFRWKSSSSSIVKVSSQGVITGKKSGSATVTATPKSGGQKLSIQVYVNRNKVDNLMSRPYTSQVSYGHCGWGLKSLEIASPTKVVAEFYLVGNFSSRKGIRKISHFTESIYAYSASTGSLQSTIVSGKSSSVKGFTSKRGAFVKVVKVTFTGSAVKNTNLILKNYKVNIGSSGIITGQFY